jgi:hypothetical protein
VKKHTAIKWAQNPVLSALLLAVCFSRVLIPAGFMPGPGGLVICFGYTPAPVAAAAGSMRDDMSGMDASQHSSHSTPGDRSSEHDGASLCPFAAAATTMASGHAAVPAAFVHSVTRGNNVPRQPLVPRGTIVPTRLPRGPPNLA